MNEPYWQGQTVKSVESKRQKGVNHEIFKEDITDEIKTQGKDPICPFKKKLNGPLYAWLQEVFQSFDGKFNDNMAFSSPFTNKIAIHMVLTII